MTGGGPFRQDPAAPGSPGRCPRCLIAMQRQETNSGVAVDVCPRHGLWFDTAELEPFLAYILSMD